MNRRLHNTYTAILASAAALTLGLMMATSPATLTSQTAAIPVHVGPLSFSYVPAQAGVDHAEQVKAMVDSIEHRADNIETLADAAALTAEIATAAALAGSLRKADANDESPGSDNKTRHRRRQTLAMPYFSFAPRG